MRATSWARLGGFDPRPRTGGDRDNLKTLMHNEKEYVLRERLAMQCIADYSNRLRFSKDQQNQSV